jgi:hypothetical protein
MLLAVAKTWLRLLQNLNLHNPKLNQEVIVFFGFGSSALRVALKEFSVYYFAEWLQIHRLLIFCC